MEKNENVKCSGTVELYHKSSISDSFKNITALKSIDDIIETKNF